LDELAKTLDKPKLQKRIQQLSLNVNAVMLVVRQVMVVVASVPLQIPNLRDPKDEIIIAAAMAGHAEVIITGDQDLLVLVEFQGISIRSPRDFLETF
jgi:putative PIN family toxin of toxin-antitoxin system